MRRPLLLLSVLAVSPVAHALDIVFDYSYDSNGFFADQARRDLLDSAASVFEARLLDSLSAITSSGVNNFTLTTFNPSAYGTDLAVANASIAADTLLVYVGADRLGGALGLGGTGYSCSGIGNFCADAAARGQGAVSGSGATDYGPWGGSLSFDLDANWFFGDDTSQMGRTQNDFYSVAVHELAHVLGFALADSFDNLVSGGFFLGPTTGPVALTGDGHWASGTLSLFEGTLQEAAMDPDLTQGTRKYFTDLDFAALDDIGWQVATVPEPETYAMMLAGLGLVGWMAGRRRR